MPGSAKEIYGDLYIYIHNTVPLKTEQPKLSQPLLAKFLNKATNHAIFFNINELSIFVKNCS